MKDKNIFFSIDVEEWWSVESFRNIKLPSKIDDRIHVGVDIILDLLEKHEQKATFFILGRVAAKYPEMVLKISLAGHEIGTHGYMHKLIYEQSPEDFEQDLVRSISTIEEIIDKKVVSYRAPSYSITERSIWALEILAKSGIKIDSSIVPTKNTRFGIPYASISPYKVKFKNPSYELTEIPPTIARFLIKLPISSGFAFRFFPTNLVHYVFLKKLRMNIIPMVIMHNWEYDRSQPYLNVGFKGRLLHYHNLKKSVQKIEFFMKNYNMIPLNRISSALPEISLSALK